MGKRKTLSFVTCATWNDLISDNIMVKFNEYNMLSLECQMTMKIKK